MQKKQEMQPTKWHRNLIKKTRHLEKQNRLSKIQDVRNELLLKALESLKSKDEVESVIQETID